VTCLQKLSEQIQAVLGLESDFSAGKTALRAIVIYGVTLLIVRLGSKRFLSKATAFDVIVAIMLGSVMSRGIDEASPLLPTVVAGVVLLGMHWLLGILAFHTNWFGPLIKGERVQLIKDGKIQQEGMRRGSITKNDLTQDMNHRSSRSQLRTA